MTKTVKYLVYVVFTLLLIGWVLKCCIQRSRRVFRPERIALKHEAVDVIKTDTGKILL